MDRKFQKIGNLQQKNRKHKNIEHLKNRKFKGWKILKDGKF